MSAIRIGMGLLEAVLALFVLSVVGLAIHSGLLSTVRRVQTDRSTEAARNLTLDLLERFCQPYTDVDSLFGPEVTTGGTRRLTLEEALALVGTSRPEVTTHIKALAQGRVSGVDLIWRRGTAAHWADPDSALRLDTLEVRPAYDRPRDGPWVGGFRAFWVRGI